MAVPIASWQVIWSVSYKHQVQIQHSCCVQCKEKLPQLLWTTSLSPVLMVGTPYSYHEPSQIPNPEMLSRWPHLLEATQQMRTYRSDMSIGLLIGTNCSKAHQPQRVIPSSGNGPFAVLYPHGGKVNGPLKINEQNNVNDVTSCNHIRMQEISCTELLNYTIYSSHVWCWFWWYICWCHSW